MQTVTKTRVATQVHSREIDRYVAHVNMRRAKLKRVNKHDHTGPLYLRERIGSYFSKYWRDYINVPTVDLRRKAK